jgi:hypothetical protein
VPGERGPSAVPMMELPARCALTISLSKYSSSKSAQLMVQKRSVSYMRCSPRRWKVLAEVQQLHDVARLERGRIGRLAQQQRLDEAALAQHVAQVALIGLGVAPGVARDLAAQRVVIVVQRQMAAVAHHGAAALVGMICSP